MHAVTILEKWRAYVSRYSKPHFTTLTHIKIIIKKKNETYLLKAVVDPKYKHPRIATITQLTRWASSGTCNLG